jgi:hypothetical protein
MIKNRFSLIALLVIINNTALPVALGCECTDPLASKFSGDPLVIEQYWRLPGHRVRQELKHCRPLRRSFEKDEFSGHP